MTKTPPPSSRLRWWLALALLPSLLRALEPNEWKHRQALAVDRAGVIKLALPPATLDLARAGLEDLRLLDGAGRETPFVIERERPSTPPTLRAPRTYRPALLDTATQLTIETGTDAPLDGVMLATPAPAFLKSARLEASTDGTTWQVVEAGVPVFRQFGAEQLRLNLGRRIASHLRITLDDARTRPVAFTGATLAVAPSSPRAVTQPLPVRIARREEFAGESVLTLDVGAAHVPLAALEFVTAEPLFARNVTVSVRQVEGDTAVERTLATGSIYRIGVDGLPPRAQLELPVDFTAPSRELLLHIHNGNSPLLALEEIRAQQRPVWLVFNAAAAGAHTLLAGNPDIAAPRYDLAALAGSLRAAAPAALVPGPAELNPGYRRVDALANTPLLGAALDPAPWRFRKAVRLTTAGVQQLELDLDVLAGAQPGGADLRLMRAGAQVPYLVERPKLSRATPLALTPANEPRRPSVSRWQLKLPRPGAPLTRLTLTSSTPLFQRHVRLLEKISDPRNGDYERTLAASDWSHAPGNDAPLTLTLSAPPQGDTLWLETDNGDNPPLALGAVQAAYPVTRLLFKTDFPPAEVVNLYYGNREVGAPRYDLALVAGQILAAEKNVATLDAEEVAKSGGWAAGALAAARGGALFWAGLAVVVVVLLAVVAKLLPKPPGQTGDR
jgi:hypothetical protein